ncbi:hypothetical protein NP233_g2060 [Leucocoprinus birnbaumii]|uniref:ATP phosphoribosyltransferase n=1 Tax=Leucocoprinus birnbaumii TaxID=56174 RepID=A0AAD5W207_9AGAR|nr:hypothetical protein NP233_g2060 [Leucocoprinus birnbaumii]
MMNELGNADDYTAINIAYRFWHFETSPSLSPLPDVPCLKMHTESLDGRLLFAIPKKGRLHEKCISLLAGADIKFRRPNRLDVCVAQNLNVALVFLPAADIPSFVGKGDVDLGITGYDVILESQMQEFVTEELKLGFGNCSLQVQVPEASSIKTSEDLAGKRVVTSFDVLAGQYFKEIDDRLQLVEGQRTRIEYVGGSVEAACALGLADGIVDLVESGETMRAAGLHAIATVIKTEAVLIKTNKPQSPDHEALIKVITKRIAGVIAAERYVVCSYNIRKDDLPAAEKVTPGRRAPTVSRLEEEGWLAVSVMVEKNKIATVMDELEKVGAEDILVFNLDNCRFIDSFTHPLNPSSPTLPFTGLDIKAGEPETQRSTHVSPEKHALHVFLVSSPPSRPLPTHQIADAISTLSRIESRKPSAASDSEEEALKSALVAKVVVGLYAQALQVYLDQATQVEAEAEWWGETEGSMQNVAWYLLQTTPTRLFRAVDAVVSAVRARKQSLSFSTFTPSSLAKLFPTSLTSPLRPSVLTTACFPHLAKYPLAVTASLYPVPLATTTYTRLTEQVAHALSYYLNQVTNYITYPLSLARHECRSHRRDLENIRNERAEILGQISQMRNHLASILTNPEFEYFGTTEFLPKVQRFVKILNQKAAIDTDITYPSLVGTLAHISNETIPELDRSHQELLKTNRLLRPRRWILIWPKVVLLPPLVLYACSSLYASRASLEEVARDAMETLKGFVRGWLLEPLRDVLRTIRSGPEDETGMLVRKEGVLADIDSLERMTLSLARDELRFNQEQLAALSRQVRLGDLTPVMQVYEEDIRTPLKSAVAGTLLRNVFIQVQKAKVDIDQALTGIDRLLKSQELTFAFVGVAPALAIVYLVGGAISGIWNGGKGRGRYGRLNKRRGVWDSMRRIERLLITQPADNQQVAPLPSGLLLLSLSRLRTYAVKYLPPNSRLREGFLEDLGDLENPDLGRDAKLEVVHRMWRPRLTTNLLIGCTGRAYWADFARSVGNLSSGADAEELSTPQKGNPGTACIDTIMGDLLNLPKPPEIMSVKAELSGSLVPNFTFSDYESFFAAGGLGAMLSHGAVTPIDVVKTRIQVDPAFKTHSLVSGTRHIISAEGPRALLTGFGPTAVGYLVQGGAKFAGYEYWKRQFVLAAGDQETAVKYRTPIYLGAAGVAEFFADILLTPLEATRIRLVSQKGYATGLVTGFARLAREGGLREMYAGFVPILFKQIPFALGQFTVNELCHELVYRNISEEQRKSLTAASRLSIDLGSGVIAGFAAAFLSQPADTLLSKINKGQGPKRSMARHLSELLSEAGVRGLFTGLGPRMIMTAGLVSSQFVMYGSIKEALGARSGVEIHKED